MELHGIAQVIKHCWLCREICFKVKIVYRSVLALHVAQCRNIRN